MILKKEFYERETITVAKQLIGKKLTRKIKNLKLTGIITETEAYRGRDDPASHAATNLTNRNQIMFGPVGMSYVYFTYGMYFMLNVVAKSKKQNAGAENNLNLTKKSSIYISEGIIPKKIKKSPRIGITKATDKKWNFSIMSKDYF